MRRQIILTVSAAAIVAGSIFAYANSTAGKSSPANSTKDCPAWCCELTGGQCDPANCD